MRIARGRPDRGGFALPVAVLALVVVGVLVTAGFYMAQQETRIGVASQNSSMAFYIAEQGMNEVLANWSAAEYSQIPLWDTATVTGTITQGGYTVNVYHLTDRLYWVESEGQVTQGGRLAGATRKMGLLAKIRTAWIDPPAALTTRGETDVGGTAMVNGYDSIPGPWRDQGMCTGTGADKPGIMTDSTDQVDTGGQGQILGDPPDSVDTSISDSTFTDYGELQWADLVELAQADGKNVSGQGSTMSGVSPSLSGGVCDTASPTNWGEPLYVQTGGTVPVAACQSYFPLVYHRGPLTIQGNSRGQGILLVGNIAQDGTMTGDLDLRGDFYFMGIIIVLGSFETQSADPKIYGGVLAGNAQVDSNGQDITGGSVVQYSSCAVTQAIMNNASLAKARPLLQRSWVDLSNVSYD